MDGLSFVIHDKAGVFQKHVVAHGGAETDLLWNAPSIASFTLDDDSDDTAKTLDAIRAPGARATVLFKGVEEFRGKITATPEDGPDGTVTCQITSDLVKLNEWFAWPIPTAAITAQTVEFRRIEGTLEDIVKGVVAENVTRLGANWVMAPSLGRGTTQAMDFRFDYIGPKVFPVLKAERYGLVLTYPSGVPTLDLRTPETVGGELDLRSGRINSYGIDRRTATATRAIIGGYGTGVERELGVVVDSATEAAFNDIIEVFVDAPSLKAGDDLTPAGEKVIAEGAASISIAMDLVEQPGFEYRSTYKLGDVVPIRFLNISEVITQVSISDDPKNGVIVTPTIGDIVRTEVDMLSKQIARLQARTQAQGRR